jgi:hypothetical protein
MNNNEFTTAVDLLTRMKNELIERAAALDTAIQEIKILARPEVPQFLPPARPRPHKPVIPTDRTTSSLSKKFKEETLEAIRGLKQPFTTGDVAKAAGLTQKGASSAMVRGVARGWINRESLGKYSRTSEFPVNPTADSNRLLSQIHSEIAETKED